jgi:hypothetical protein
MDEDEDIEDDESVEQPKNSQKSRAAHLAPWQISDLFQARKDLDSYIEKVFPDLYSSERLTPMRSAVKDIRNALTDFTADHLPPDIGLRDSLTSQSHLLQAIENMAEKAASGVKTEVGTNVVERATSAVWPFASPRGSQPVLVMFYSRVRPLQRYSAY